MALHLWLLLACIGTTPRDGCTVPIERDSAIATDTSTWETAEPTHSADSASPVAHRWHALLTADGLLSKQHPPLVEVDSDLERVWTQDFQGEHGRGAQGIDRAADGRTVYTRIGGDVSTGWVDLLAADGSLAWTWDGASVGGLSFPHAVVFTPAGDLIVADTAASRLLSVDLDGQLLWEEPIPTAAPNGLDLRVDAAGEAHLLITGIRSLAGDPAETEELVSRYVLGERTASPELLWTQVVSVGPDAGDSPHGPALLEDGTALYCARGRSQIVQLDAAGEEIWRSGDSTMLSQPKDVVQVDGAWLVVDTGAHALLRIEDPFGAFEQTASASLDGVFGVSLVWCGDGGGLPCLGP
jgi:hypothetical protein